MPAKLSPIRRLARHINRIRLNMAEGDLAFLEARAPAAIAEQRQRVLALRRVVLLEDTAATVARIEHNIKRAGVLS